MARRDGLKHVTNSGFSVDITIESANGLITKDVSGLASKHWLNFGTDGNSVNSKNAHVSISEDQLNKLEFPVRNDEKEIDLKNCKIYVKDSSSLTKKYVINECFPSETFGLIACLLGDYYE